jgi:hypothetical protein
MIPTVSIASEQAPRPNLLSTAARDKVGAAVIGKTAARVLDRAMAEWVADPAQSNGQLIDLEERVRSIQVVCGQVADAIAADRRGESL